MSDGGVGRRVRSGDKLVIPADTWDAMLEMLGAWRGGRLGGVGVQAPQETSAVVKVRNDAGAVVPQFGVLRHGDTVITPAASGATFRERRLVKGLTPKGPDDIIVILQEPLAPKAVGRAVVAGETPVLVNFANKRQMHAMPGTSTANLVGGAPGAIPLTWREEPAGGPGDDGSDPDYGTGILWAMALLPAPGTTEQFVLVTGAPEKADQQTVSVTGGPPTGGTFPLTFGGQTATIAYNATAADVQTAFTALSSVGAGNATVSGGPLPGSPIVITFAGTLAGATQPAITSGANTLSPASTVSIRHDHGVNHFYHAKVQFRDSPTHAWTDGEVCWLDPGDRDGLDSGVRYYARLTQPDPTDAIPTYVVVCCEDDAHDCCCGATGLSKPLGGPALGQTKKCCCGGGIKPPGDGGGGGGGDGTACPNAVYVWVSSSTAPNVGYMYPVYGTPSGCIYGPSTFNVPGPPAGFSPVGSQVSPTGVVQSMWSDRPDCLCKGCPLLCTGSTGGGTSGCCPPGFTGLTDCLVNGVMQVVNCGAPMIRGGGAGGLGGAGLPLGGLGTPLGGGVPLGGGPVMPEVTAGANTFTDTQTVLQPTAGAVILSQQTTTATNPIKYESLEKTVNTTDGTTTTLLTFPVTDDATHAIKLRVYARRTGGSSGTAGNAAEYEGRFGVRRSGGGGAAFVGTSTPPLSGTADESAIGFGAVVDVSGNNLRVRVTGATNNNYRWDCFVEYGTITN